MNKKDTWFSAIARIENQDEFPDNLWKEIHEKLNSVYSDIKVFKYQDFNINNFKFKIDLELSKTNIKEILKLIKPGRTTTISVEKKEFEKIKKDYPNFKNINNFSYIITLNYRSKTNKQIKDIILRVVNKKIVDKVVNFIASTNSINLFSYCISELIEKIEKSVFCKGGDRVARWKVDKLHSEYGDKEECLRIAISLTKNLLYAILDSKTLGYKIQSQFNKIKKLVRFIEKKEDIKGYKPYIVKNICPFCFKKYYFENLILNSRNHPNSLALGHDKPRSNRYENNHKVENVFWIHRRCNNIQGGYTIVQSLEFMKEILDSRNIKNYQFF